MDEERPLQVDASEREPAVRSEQERLAHVLHRYDGLTDGELAAILQTSPSNCRTLVSRATRALRTAMEMDP